MLFLTFEIAGEAYALPARDIVEILPLVTLRPVWGAPPELAGALRYRGAFVPVVDLAQLAGGPPSEARMGTRIVTVALEHRGAPRLVGLVAERATETFSADPADFAPFAHGPRGLVQWLKLDRLLPAPSRDRLFAELAAAPA